MSFFITVSLCGLVVFQQLLVIICAFPAFGDSDEDILPQPNKRFNFMTPNAWVEKWKKSGHIKRSFKFSSPNAWADKWKKSVMGLEKRNSDSMPESLRKQASYATLCGNIHQLIPRLQISQNTLNQLLQDCVMTDIPKPECLSRERKLQLQELYETTKMEARIIDWCLAQNRLHLGDH